MRSAACRFTRLAASFVVAASATAGSLALAASARAQQPVAVDVIEIRGLVDPPTAAHVRQVIEGAALSGSSAVLVDIDSPGALAVDLAFITPIVESSVPVIAWIGPGARARGGAAFAAVAADVVIMAPDGQLGPAVPFELGDGEPGDADPAGDGLTDYTKLRRTLPGPAAVAVQLAADLATEAFDGQATLELGLTMALADSREAGLAGLTGTTVTKGTTVHALRFEPGATQLRIHGLTTAQRLLRAAADPTTAFLLLVVVVAAVLSLPMRPGLATLVLGLTGPFAVFGIQVVPATWWAIGLIVAGVVLVTFDTAVVWIGGPTAAGILALVVGGVRLTRGAERLDVDLGALVVVALAAAAISWSGNQRQVRRLLLARDEEEAAATPLAH